MSSDEQATWQLIPAYAEPLSYDFTWNYVYRYGLTAYTTYWFRVTAYDANYNPSVSTPISYRVVDVNVSVH
jgi:hypothetical protein